MASLIHEISTHAYNKAKYLKSPGKDESGNPVEVVRITKKSELPDLECCYGYDPKARQTCGAKHPQPRD